MAGEITVGERRQVGKLAGLDPKDILERYLNGETSPQIAESYGVTKQALSLWLISKGESDWKAAQLVKAIERKDKAEDLIETAQTMLDLTRGREMLRAAQWDLERVCRRIYGQDAPAVSQAVQVVLNIDVSEQQKEPLSATYQVGNENGPETPVENTDTDQ